MSTSAAGPGGLREEPQPRPLPQPSRPLRPLWTHSPPLGRSGPTCLTRVLQSPSCPRPGGPCSHSVRVTATAPRAPASPTVPLALGRPCRACLPSGEKPRPREVRSLSPHRSSQTARRRGAREQAATWRVRIQAGPAGQMGHAQVSAGAAGAAAPEVPPGPRAVASAPCHPDPTWERPQILLPVSPTC